MKINMENLKTLVQKLLKFCPTKVMNGLFDDDVIEYYNDNISYSISVYSLIDNSKYYVKINISNIHPYEYINDFNIEVTEKEYMETKWQIEDWIKYLNEKQLLAFEEFVNSFENNSMDDLLND